MPTNKYTEAEIEQIIKEHIIQNFMYNRSNINFSNEMLLIEAGIIDSISIFKLASFLEEKFGFTLNSKELLLDNFESVNAIKHLVVQKVVN
ncbi:MAG: acyl carrier protein [Nostoc sp. DedQUE01]|nr:acyl carrier protein [Nostoc sp. DedQUE11]MDZ8072181.1 acyl carrier protein [Nostoc sp. DedQUE01]